MEEDDDVTPFTLLAADWANRDDLYARLGKWVGEPGIRAVRRGRVAEAEKLPEGPERMQFIQRARHWWPPEHGQ